MGPVGERGASAGPTSDRPCSRRRPIDSSTAAAPRGLHRRFGPTGRTNLTSHAAAAAAAAAAAPAVTDAATGKQFADYILKGTLIFVMRLTFSVPIIISDLKCCVTNCETFLLKLQKIITRFIFSSKCRFRNFPPPCAMILQRSVTLSTVCDDTTKKRNFNHRVR